MDPATIVTALSLLWSVWQTWKAGKFKSAASTLVDAIEEHAVKNNSNNVKNTVAIQAVADATKKTIDAILEKKGYRDLRPSN